MAPWILHLDFDAFFASVEQLRNPRLSGRPIAVGRGVVASASYEARASGIRAGMACARALRLCPRLVIVPPRGEIYRAVSEEAFELCRSYAPSVETYLDEADLDLTGTERLHGGHAGAARRIQAAIAKQTGLTVSAGLGANRMIAALAAKAAKPRGLGLIPHGDEEAFVARLPIEKLPGIGPARARALRKLNIAFAADLRGLARHMLADLFGAAGLVLFERCRGRDIGPCRRSEFPRAVSRQTDLAGLETNPDVLEARLRSLVEDAGRALRRLGLVCRTAAVTIEYLDGIRAAASHGLAEGARLDDTLFEAALCAYRRARRRAAAPRGLRVALHRLAPDTGTVQPTLDDRGDRALARHALMDAQDAVRNRFGGGALLSGRTFLLRTLELRPSGAP